MQLLFHCIFVQLIAYASLWVVAPFECPIIHSKYEKKKLELEAEYRARNDSVSMLFGHVHHAGGTAVCALARNNTSANPKFNCNHPLEFKGVAPTTGSIAEQLKFRSTTSWKFYAVELKMPQYMKFGGPLIYSIVIRHPYMLLASQYRRGQRIHKFQGSITDLVSAQLSRVGTSQRSNSSRIYTNYYRGLAGFILGRYGPTNVTDDEMLNRAKYRLERFSVIILTEEMRTTGKLFNIKFGWDTSNFGTLLVNSHGETDELVQMMHSFNQDEKSFIRKHALIDMQLYHFARCLVQRDLSVVNISLPDYSYYDVDNIFS